MDTEHQQDYLKLINAVLKATEDSKDNPQVVYALLQAHLDLLDDNFAVVLRNWATATLLEMELEQAKHTAINIGNFSVLISDFPLGEWASNLEIAITGYEVVRTVFTRQAFPQEWATTQINLGAAYRNRIRGEKAENLERAIYCQLTALEVYTRQTLPQEWATTKISLGNAYSERIRAERAENLEEAIRCYLAALEVSNREVMAELWVYAKIGFGTAYLYRIRGERAENLETAIQCYLDALEVCTREAFPQRWAAIQINLGLAYNERVWGERAENLEKAIGCHSSALEEYTREAYPELWARTQLNLGYAYFYRILGESAENLEIAICCFSDALKEYTRQAFSERWADTKHNLGLAYTYRIRGEMAQNLEAAIGCFLDALEIRTRDAFPEKWAETQINLSLAYRYRLWQERAENLEKAIHCLLEGLEVNTYNAFPRKWAISQINLGSTYCGRIRGDKAENLETAIHCYLAALEVITPNTFPQQWAETQKNLGNAYRERIQGDKAENLQTAIHCYLAALEVSTREAFPKNHAVAQFNLGLAYQSAQQLPNAYSAFRSAIETVEFLRGEILSGSGIEEDKQKLAEQWNELYQGIVEVCLELDNLTEAIEYIERSRTRNLVELLASRNLYPKGEIPQPVLKQLNRLRREIAAQQRQIEPSGRISDQQRIRGDEQNRPIAAIPDHSRLNALREQLDNLIMQQIQPIDSTFSLTQRIEPISYQQIRNLLPDDQTALIEWYITGNTFITAIITRDATSPRIWQSTSDDLQALLNWLDQYLTDYSRQKDQWREGLESRLKELADILHVDQIFSYPQLENCERLILIPHRFLHLLPLHALPLANRESGRENGEEESSCVPLPCLLDRFSRGVSYAPSCQLLQLTQNQKRPNFTYLFAIQNPTGDLDYTDIEVATIRQRFYPCDRVLVQDAAKKASLGSHRLEDANLAHFSCHAYFNFEDPLRSALLLADCQITPAPADANPPRYLPLKDGSVLDLQGCLTLGEIFALELSQCRLVTLSACETGLTDFRNVSDEYISLPAGFLYAGSPSVVASLWAVNDLSTALLMIKFYENLFDDTPVAVALNSAQLWLRDSSQTELLKWTQQLNLNKHFQQRIQQELDWFEGDEQPFSNPGYWAAFCAVGE
ncbi:CHAT domain-containing protein [Microcoleus sp. FACHB-53]|nr:CHAT domain-containing protein [Microcoleus sp. FACHB-53]